MSKKRKPKEDKVGRWSEEKLDLLGKYLQAYAKIMNKQKKQWLSSYHYIDAFAGSGQPTSKDTGLYIEGSPLKALLTEPPFDCYWFIEKSSWRIERLQDLRKQFPRQRIEVRQGNCNEILGDEVIPLITRASKQRGLVFLDPHGLQIEWETVKKLAGTKAFDIFVNFSLMGVTRLLKRDAQPDERSGEILDRVMGTHEWVQEIYRPERQLPLFGEQLVIRDIMRAEWLARLYLEQINQHIRCVSRPFIMKNSRNAPLYALFLASHKFTATKIMNDIFNKLDRLRELGR